MLGLGVCQFVYLFMVANIWVRPYAFPKRKVPLWLVRAHNAFLVVWSWNMMNTGVIEYVKNGYQLYGNDYDPSENVVKQVAVSFYRSKIYEFIDTFLMIYKGNYRQVSFLHVYHHLSVTVWWFYLTQVMPGGEALVPLIVNSGIHVIMYAYYFLTTILPREYMWWGRYLTWAQMVQFVFLMTISVLGLCTPSNTPRIVYVHAIWYYMSLFALFAKFYLGKYQIIQTSHKFCSNAHQNVSASEMTKTKTI